MGKSSSHTCVLSQKEIEELIKDIEGHAWFWRASAEIEAEKKRRRAICKECLKGENYG